MLENILKKIKSNFSKDQLVETTKQLNNAIQVIEDIEVYLSYSANLTKKITAETVIDNVSKIIEEYKEGKRNMYELPTQDNKFKKIKQPING